MTFIGIDPGLEGGIAVTNKSLGISLLVEVMPFVWVGKKRQIDEAKLAQWLQNEAGCWDGCQLGWPTDKMLVTIEKVHSMPKQGVASTFTFGTGYGLVRGMCAALRIPYQLVTPQAWKKVMLAGYEKGSEYQVASHLWPDVDFRATERRRKPHAGMVDAALICEFGRRTGKGVQNDEE